MGKEWKELKDARIKAGMTQLELAYKAKLSIAQASQYETGKTSIGNMRLKSFIRLAKALGLTLDELIGEKINDPDILE